MDPGTFDSEKVREY